MSENERRSNRNTSKELNIVLKELRKAQRGMQEDQGLDTRLTSLDKEVVILKTILSVTATAILVAWTVFSSFVYSEIETIKANSQALLAHEFRLESQRSAITRIDEEKD